MVLDGTIAYTDTCVQIEYRIRPDLLSILFIAVFALALVYAAICVIISIESIPFLIAALIANVILALDVVWQIKFCTESFLNTLHTQESAYPQA